MTRIALGISMFSLIGVATALTMLPFVQAITRVVYHILWALP